MGLETAGACFLPYGFEQQEDGTWAAFNREYFPLFASVKIKALTLKKLATLGLPPKWIVSADQHGFTRFYLYDTDTSPWESAKHRKRYFDLLDRLLSLKAEAPLGDRAAWLNHHQHRITILKWNRIGKKDQSPPPPPPSRREPTG